MEATALRKQAATNLGRFLDPATLSLIAQIGSMALAAIIARYLLRSTALIWLVAFLGAFGAMAAHMMHDGQGAFILLLFTPVIYFLAVAGRDEVGGRRRL